MDIVQICAQGLVDGIDKFCLPFTPVFRSVCIGRMVGEVISVYSSTMLHFYPNDRKKIYWGNKYAGPRSEVDYELLALKINDKMDPAMKTTPSEMAELLQAISPFSADTRQDDGEESPVSSFAMSDALRPDVQVERTEAEVATGEAIKMLPVFLQKVLRLKGIDL